MEVRYPGSGQEVGAELSGCGANARENSKSALGSHQQRETGHLTLQAWELGEVGAAHTKEDQTWEPCEKEVMDRCDGRGLPESSTEVSGSQCRFLQWELVREPYGEREVDLGLLLGV